MTKVCVTGASGYLGSFVALECLKAGYFVNATVRELTEEKTFLNRFAIELGLDDHLKFYEIPNIAEVEGYAEAFEGCEYVMHVASPVMFTAEDPERDIIQPALNGTLNAMNVALSAGVKHVVVISSLAAMIGDQRAENPEYVFTENDWNNNPGSHYSRSKTLAEKAAWNFVEEHPEIGLTVFCPAFIMGPPLDANNMSSVGTIAKLVNGQYNEQLPAMKVAHIDVRDLSELCIKAITDERARNQRYVICNDPQYGVAHFAKIINENFEGFNLPTEYQEPMTFLAKGTDSSKAIEFLGHELIPLEQSIIDTINRFKDLGILEQ